MIAAYSVLKGLPAGGGFDSLRKLLVEKPLPLIGRETIQIALVREVQDYTILRTEETRELNTVWTVGSGDGGGIERVAFLASKQKGAESREIEGLLRTWNAAAGRAAADCYLKSKLCMTCPRCVLFGATDVSTGREKGANIKHRIAYATAFSLLPVDPSLRESHTFNGIDGATQLTGQTLGERESVRPGALFAGIVTLRSVTEIEMVFALKTILSCTRYGAETRIGGIVRNHVLGVAAAHEEVISPLELTLALAGGGAMPSAAAVTKVLAEYKAKCATPAAAHVLTDTELGILLDAVQKVEPTRQHLDAAYGTGTEFRKSQANYMRKAKD
jgi:CRISPR type I-D-associated protein Csc2